MPKIVNEIFVVANEPKYLLGTFLKTKRFELGLSVKDLIHSMGEKSETAYRRYEQGEIMPSFEKLDQILKAMNPKYETILKIG